MGRRPNAAAEPAPFFQEETAQAADSEFARSLLSDDQSEGDGQDRNSDAAGGGYGLDFGALASMGTQIPYAAPVRTTAPVGAAVASPVIWPGAEAQGVALLRVQRRDPSGRLVDIGTIAANATDVEAIGMVGTPGTYRFIPLNELGEELRLQPVDRTYAAEHAAFKAAAAPSRAPSAGVAGALDPAILDLIKTSLEQAREDRRLARELEERALSRRDTAAAVVQETAVSAYATSVAAFNERENERQAAVVKSMIEAQKIAQQATEQSGRSIVEFLAAQNANTMQLMNLQMEQQRLAHERTLAEQAARMERDRMEMERRRDADQREYERRMKEENDRREREERERRDREERYDRERREREERERERDREHREMLAKMQAEADKRRDEAIAAKDPIKTVVGTAMAAKPLLDLLGVDLSDLKSLLGGGASGGVIATAIEQFGKIATKYIEVAAGGGDDEGEEGEEGEDDPNDPIVALRFADGSVRNMRKSEADRLLAAQAAQAAQQQQPQIAQQQIPPGWGAPAQAPEAVPAQVAQAGQAGQVTAQPAQPADTAKAAKQAIARLVNALHDYPEDDGTYTRIIRESIALAPEIAAYLLGGASVREALADADARPATADRVLRLLRAEVDAGHIPPLNLD